MIEQSFNHRKVGWHVFPMMLLSSLQDIRDLSCASWLWFNGHLSTKINNKLVLLLSLYQFSVTGFSLSDLFFSFWFVFPSIGKWWMHGEVERVHQCNITICQHHSQFSFIWKCQQSKELPLISVDEQPLVKGYWHMSWSNWVNTNKYFILESALKLTH